MSELLLRNCKAVVTQNEDRDILRGKDVLIDDNRIESIGENLDAEKVLDCSRKIVLPGLVNGHTHSAMSFAKGASDNKPLFEWFEEIDHIFWSMEDYVETATRYSILEMALTGTTLFNETWGYCFDIAEIADEIGIKVLMSEMVSDETLPEEPMKRFGDFVAKYSDSKFVKPGIGPHSVYRCNRDCLEKVKQISEKHGLPVHIHLAEAEKENQINDKRPLEILEDTGLLNRKLIAAHCVHLDNSEIERFNDAEATIAYNPGSNMKLGSGNPKIHRYENRVLSTDSAASNNNLNMFEEMKIAGLLSNLRNPSDLPAQEILDMATVEGARALGYEDKGVIAEGMKADIITIDASHHSLTPEFGEEGLVSNIVYSFNGEVEDNIIEGNFIVRDGEPQFKTDGINQEIQELSDRALNL